MKNMIYYLISILIFNLTTFYASDTLVFKSSNGRYDCIIICKSQKGTFSESFLQQLAQSKQGSLYILTDSSIIIDGNKPIIFPNFNLQDFGNYVSSQKCFQQRNYSLAFTKTNIDSYKAKLTILTNWRQTTVVEFNIILQPLLFLSNGTIQYKELNGNIKFTSNVPDSIIMENLFIENEPCPRAILFPK